MSNSERDERQLKPADLRGILKYVPMFRDHIFVIALDGSIIEHENFANTITDIAVLRSLNIKVVLVHGIGKQLRDAAAQRGIVPGDVYGEGPTDAAMLALARETTGVVVQTIIEALSHSGLKTAMSNAVRSTEIGVIRGCDQQFTGKVDKIDTSVLKSLLDQGVIPLLTPILCNREGRSLRVNSDLLACEIAIALGASKLVFLTPFRGLVIDDAVTVNIPLQELSALFREKRAHVIAERLRSKATYAIRALENGTTRAHILDGRATGALLTEIFDKVGTGTMIHANEYDQIRSARKKDAQAIHNITKQGVRNETLVQRTRAHNEQHIEEYFVYEIDESVIGCACLRRYPEKKDMEVGSVYVQPHYHGRGVGKKLVEYAVLKAAETGAKRLFALTTQSHAFFRDICQFEDGTPDDLPPQRRAEAQNSGRNARVLFRRLKRVKSRAERGA
ncbi:MAG: amino-acid N-acetyltransferase [Puniceicoccales bacterium]|jgi:amino-acid N-acetyltransferase|nr:amino-acid N-acetyltransferase [Puniceicoccales bacterium]